MARCIEIAKNAMGTAPPNPMVGAVIVSEDRIIGEGYTSAFGGPHAEVNAFDSVKDASLLPKATLYVTLEPCSHYGKTPPCADLILESGIPNVVIGIEDPNEKVAGSGIQRLQQGGCKVITGVLAQKCRDHHRRFLTYHEKKRPYVILKWAESADGYIAPESNMRESNPKPYWISSKESRQLVHKWRSEEQAILVGTNTALQDNPSLTTRMWKGINPIRVLLDRNLKVSQNFKLFSGNTPTLVLTHKANQKDTPGVEYITLPKEEFDAQGILKALWERGISSIIVEGGKKVLDLFLHEELWDEARIFTGTESLDGGLKAPNIKRENAELLEVGADELKIIRND